MRDINYATKTLDELIFTHLNLLDTIKRMHM